MVVINNDPALRTIDPARFDDVLAGDETGVDVLSGQRYRMDAPFEVGANSVILLEFDPPR